MQSGQTIAVANQKGGVAKTTTAINLSAALGQKGVRVLLVDLDPQGNATTGCGISKVNLKKSAYDVLMGYCAPSEAILPTDFNGVDIIPATPELAQSEIRLMQTENKTLQLKTALVAVKNDYDFIIIDCLPSLGILALNGISACDNVIIPMQCEPYSLEGVAELLGTVKKIRQTANKQLGIMGVVFTMLDARLNVNREVKDKIRQKFPPELVFQTEIPRNVRIAEAPSHGKPIVYYEPKSPGALSYIRLADEVLMKSNRLKTA